ncbi:MAG: hypothetical protein J7L15_02555 [Clostridiales bacterium]|nr:hypothetical protein [Clostridiales bacterium]
MKDAQGKSKLKLTKKVKISKNPTSTYKLTIIFDDGDDIELLFASSTETLKYEAIYTDYLERLRKNWNDWCNPDTEDIESLLQDHGVPDEPDEVWAWSNEYPDPMARVDSTQITYYNNNGIEYHTKKVH